MKSKLMSIAMAVMIAAAGFSVSAQNDNEGRGPRQHKQGCVEGKKDRPDCCDKQNGAPDCKKAGKKVKGGNLCNTNRLLQGITLTPEQQAKVDALQQKNKAEFEKQKAEQKKEAEKKRAEAEKKMQKKAEELDKDMKKILTPEQYAVFQQNVAKAKADRQKMKDGKKNKEGKKGQRDGKKGGKDGKGPRDGKKGDRKRMNNGSGEPGQMRQEAMGRVPQRN